MCSPGTGTVFLACSQLCLQGKWMSEFWILRLFFSMWHSLLLELYSPHSSPSLFLCCLYVRLNWRLNSSPYLPPSLNCIRLVYVCLKVHGCHDTCVPKSALSFRVGCRDWIQVIRLGCRYHSLLLRLAGSTRVYPCVLPSSKHFCFRVLQLLDRWLCFVRSFN